MSGYQIEDNLMVEMLDVARRRNPRHNFWQRTRKPSPSYNWFSMATAIGVHMGDDSALAALTRVWGTQNDLWAQEPYPDGSHCLMTLLGLYLLRRATRVKGDVEAYNRANNEILQFWAMYLLCSTNPLEPGKNRVAWPGTRAAAPALGRGLMDYMFLIGMGWTEDRIRRQAVEGKSLVNQAHRIYKNQEDFTHSEWATYYVEDLKRDLSTVTTALREGNFPGLVPFFKYGTRKPFEYLRLADGTFYAVLEENCGIDGPRWVSIGSSEGKVPTQFPTKAVPRMQHETGFAKIDRANKVVIAEGEHSGSFRHPISNAELILSLRLSSDGIKVEVPVVAPPPVVIPPEIDPAEGQSWWDRIKKAVLNFLDGVFNGSFYG